MENKTSTDLYPWWSILLTAYTFLHSPSKWMWKENVQICHEIPWNKEDWKCICLSRKHQKPTGCGRVNIFITIFGARTYWVSRFPGHPKMVTETQILEWVFRPEIQVLWPWWTTLYLGFLTGNQETARCGGSAQLPAQSGGVAQLTGRTVSWS